MGLNDLRYFGFRRTRGDASRVDSASQGVPALLVPTGDRDMHFASAADEATDWNVANPTHPTWYIHSETTPATDYASFDHDATDFTLNVASGSFTVAMGGTDKFAVTSGGDLTLVSGNGLNVGSATQLTVSDGDGATNLIPEVQALGVGTAFAGGAVAIATFNTTNDRTVSPKLAFVKGAAATQVATTAVADNEVVGSIIAYGSDSADFETAVGAIEFVVDDSGGPGAGAIGGSIEFYTTADGGETLTAAMTINTAQNLIIGNGNGVVVGYTAQIAAGAVTSEFQMHGTAPADSTALLAAWSADAVPPRLYFAKSRSATIGTFGIITTGDNLGEILAFGDDGVDFNSNGNASCAIIFDSAGTIAADRVPGQMLLQTATDAAPSVLTTALTISSAQKLTGAAGMALTTGNFETVAGTLDIQDGGAVTQLTSKATGVTLNTYTGQITLNNAALAADAIVSFTLTNSVIAANDIIVLQHHSVATVGAYVLTAQPGAGSCVINVANRSAGSLSEAIVISFAVIKAAVT